MLLCIPALTFAQEEATEICIEFRVGKSILDKDFGQNEYRLQEIIDFFKKVESDSTLELKFVEFAGAASPEGSSRLNRTLSRQRLQTLEKYIRQRVNIPDDIISRNDMYIPFDLLADMVKDVDIENKDTVLKILKYHPMHYEQHNNGKEDVRVSMLKKIDNGRTWRKLHKMFFPKMRTACALIVTYRKFYAMPPAMDITLGKMEPLPLQHMETIPTELRIPRKRIFAVKTNGLMWASGLVFNAGAELRIAEHFSIEAIGCWSPYDLFSDTRRVRLFGIQPEVRYWFTEAMERGHFVGLHTHVLGFNVQLNDRFRFQDPNHATWGLGATYGYYMPISRKYPIGMEFVIGLGYADIKYDTYEGRINGKYLHTKEKYYWGITRLGVNFSWKL